MAGTNSELSFDNVKPGDQLLVKFFLNVDGNVRTINSKAYVRAKHPEDGGRIVLIIDELGSDMPHWVNPENFPVQTIPNLTLFGHELLWITYERRKT